MTALSAKSIVMCSGKGGTGKSCVAAYISEALARAGRKTLLLELDESSRSLDLVLGVSAAAFGVGDVLDGLCEWREAVCSVERTDGLYLMAPGSKSSFEMSDIDNLLKMLKSEFDFILIDGVAKLSSPIETAELFVLVTTPDSLSVRACAEVSRRLYTQNVKEIALLINDVPAQIPAIIGAEDFDEVIDIIGARLLGVIPQSPKLRRCANSGTPLDDDSLTLKVFEHIAGRLMGRRMPLLIR